MKKRAVLLRMTDTRSKNDDELLFVEENRFERQSYSFHSLLFIH